MPTVKVNRESHRALVEEHWWEGILGYDKVDVHCMVYRCDNGQNKGQYGAKAHIHLPGGGKVLLSSGRPTLEGYVWFTSRDDAINEALHQLEAQEDVRPK